MSASPPSSSTTPWAPALLVLRDCWEALLGLAAVAAIVAIAVVTPHKRPEHVAATHARPVKVAAAKPKPPVRKLALPKPSAFALEQQMSFSQLMKRWDPTIAEAAKKYGVPQPWIRAVMQIESGGRTMLGENQPIKSNMGAMGLMQLMPETYNDMRVQYSLGKDPYDPHDNIMAGAAYLKFLRARYGYPQMFAAYNDGPGNLEARMMGRGLLPLETQNYMVNIATAMAKGMPGGAKVKLTRPNGEPALINAAAVVSIRAAFPGEYAPGVQTVVTVGRLHQGVRESLVQARALIRAHGGGV
ncbi:MAG TPA: transglycosylase SLT domain-containing protein [Rhizomicrobium sp.]